jgi:hypothetical protein
MSRRHQVDVVTTQVLKAQHDSAQTLVAEERAVAAMADRPVLAIGAQEIAVAEEDRAGPMAAHQRRLLSEMWVGRGHLHARGSSAHARFALQPVDSAPSRAELATSKKRVQGFRPAREFAVLSQANVCRMPVRLLHDIQVLLWPA